MIYIQNITITNHNENIIKRNNPGLQMPNNVEPNFFHPWLQSVTLANDSLPLALHQGVEEESFGGGTV